MKIDLEAMNRVEVSENKIMASMGVSARWIEVHEILDPLYLTVVGGRLASVGVLWLLPGDESLLPTA